MLKGVGIVFVPYTESMHRWGCCDIFANFLLFWHSYPRVSKVVEVGDIGSVMSSPFAFTISKVLVSYFNPGRPHHFFIFYFVKIVLFDLSASDDTQKSHKPRHRMHRTLGSSHHKTMSRSFSGDSHSKGSVSMPHGSAVY